MTITPSDLLTRADREEAIYGQKELPAMLRAGAEAMAEVERLRAALRAIAETSNYTRAAWMQDTARVALPERKSRG